ncbi:MAG: DUF6754 domain-containing protein [candidate division WOR-3 bacterium]
MPNDEGGAIELSWQAGMDTAGLLGFKVWRLESGSMRRLIGEEPASARGYIDADSVLNMVPYYYYVEAYSQCETAVSDRIGPVFAKAQWFNTSRVNVLVLTVVVCCVFGAYTALTAGGAMLRWQALLFLPAWPVFPILVCIFSRRSRKARRMFIRRIAGLDAIDEALGRATEMGRPILFSFGLGYITDLVVVAALPLLRRVARKSAEYSVRLVVPNSDPLVMTAAQETVKEAYTESGRPDLYSADNITFLTADQFGYAAGVDGIILREKPGAIFWLGYFYAESLIMSETGHSVGAIQLAGTTETTQLPFFVAACDYTMIGEEIFAASCYLKPEPLMLGSLKGEDLLKLVLIVAMTVVTVGATVASISEWNWLQQAVAAVVSWLAPSF